MASLPDAISPVSIIAPPPSPEPSAVSHLDLMLSLRRFRSSQLHQLIDCIRRSDESIDAAAFVLIDDMLPMRKGYPPFPVERIKRFGTADLRELALSLCLASPGAKAVALAEIERINAAFPGWFSPRNKGPGSPTATTSSSSSSDATGGSSSNNNKKLTLHKLKEHLRAFLDLMEYANDGNIHRG